MSATYGWRPIHETSETISTTLAYLLAARAGQGVTEIAGQRLTSADRQWLLGVAAGAGEGGLRDEAMELLDAIDRHDTIELTIGY